LGGKDTVLQRRLDHDDERDGSGAASETLRSAAESSALAKSAVRDDEKMSLFWRVFGGTILSIVALGSITLYNGLSSNIAELRSELNRERDARAELVKKDEFNSRTSNQYERMRSFDGLKADHEALKERLSANASSLEAMKKDFAGTVDSIKKDAAALEVLKERLTAVEVVKKEVAGIELLRERLTSIAADLKTHRDEVTKLHQEVERNRSGDGERKTARDAQLRQVEETVKELQKGLQICREKLARLEGAQPGGSSRGSSVPSKGTSIDGPRPLPREEEDE